MKRQPNILFCTHTSPTYMPVAELSTRQVVAGPNMPYKKSGMGRIMSIKTARVFDLAALIDGLPIEQKPDLVIVLIDAFGGVRPTNLKSVKCRKVVYLADTHHGKTPLCSVLNYLQNETFDRYAIAHDPHHLHWYVEAGLQSPSIQLNLNARDHIKPQFPSSRIPQLFFVGQTAAVHVWRKKLFERLEQDGVPFTQKSMLASEAAQSYDKYQLCLNTSNGDWTMRFFEVLSAGGCLLTDRIAEASGCSEYFKDGEDIIFYDGENDLVEKTKYYLAQPDLCLKIARSGHTKYKQHFSEAKRKERFLEFAFSNDDVARSIAEKDKALDSRSTNVTAETTALLPARILAYEQIQELQRIDAIRHVAFSKSVPEVFQRDVSDLMRVAVSTGEVESVKTCLVLHDNETKHCLTIQNVKPQFVFLIPGSNSTENLENSFRELNYGLPGAVAFFHPGFFELQTKLD